jgi:hypothetical protein
MDVAIDPVETCRPLSPTWTVWAAQCAIYRPPVVPPRGARSGKLSATERSALNQALAKALAFRGAGKMPEAREWAAELIRLLELHDLLM